LAVALRQEDEQFHGDFFELEDTVSLAHLITAAVELEFRKSRYPGWHGETPLGKG
jgi:hypothetical protein